jgi:hypothetical protein
MKRFALLFALLVLSSQMVGCGEESTATSKPGGVTATGPDPGVVGAAKKDQDKRKAEEAERAAAKAAKKE